LFLLQQASGGAGGSATAADSTAGAGGTASSDLTYTDDAASSLRAQVTAAGGSGGLASNGATAGTAGSATASLTLTSTNDAANVFGIANATGGNVVQGTGSDATATTLVSGTGFLDASASASGGTGEELGLALKVTVRHQLEAQGKVRLPQSWVGLVSSLEGARARSISRARFDTQCTKHGIQASPALVLEYLHRSGRVFWRKWLFSNHVVLDQPWALEGAYAILER
jgi:hypothetical protein